MTYTGWALRRRASFLGTLVLGLIVVADWLFYDQPVGWTLSLFGMLLLGAITLRDGRYMQTKPGRIVAAATVGLAVSLLINPGPLAVTLGILGLITLASIDRSGWTSSVAQWIGRWLAFALRGLTQATRDARLQGRWARKHPPAHKTAAGLNGLGGWSIPLLLSAVFVALFAVANPVVQQWVQEGWAALSTRISNLDKLIAPWRILLWLGTGLSVWALLRVRTKARRRRRTTTTPNITALQRLERATGITLVVRCLILFNAVFAVQTALDAAYLYGGAALPQGMTYAQYAHRGAYPLVATALLAGLFVLLMFGPGGAAQRSVWARRLVHLWVAQNILLMVSSVWRLSLYIQVYSLTRWRIAAAIWMVLVGLGFAWLIWRIAADHNNRWLLQRVTLTTAVVLYALCFINIDQRIAKYNVAHCAEMGGQGPTIDMAYLQQLGPASLPATEQLRKQGQLSPPQVRQLHTTRQTLHRRLDQHMVNWRGWTLQRSRLDRTVATR